MIGSKRVKRLQKQREARTEAHAEIATKAAAYIRVSTEEQAQHGHGLENQSRAVKAFAESQGFKLIHTATDAGISGATRPSERDGFRGLLDLAREKAFSVLLVYKFDRLARQIVYAVTAVNDLAELGVDIKSVTEPISTDTPMGRTVFAVLAGMAEQERQAITERTWGGRREKASKGGIACGPAPFGYACDREGGLVIVDKEAAVVRRIFDERAAGRTLQVIADGLNADGITTKRGSRWAPGNLNPLLDNPKYRGAVEYLFRWNGAETHVLKRGKHKAIVK